ncbi:beta-xylosidase-like protein [Dictyostelium discoideum AX4]|uniref:Beta-xylosidase-like protein n=1 Tax=Dictyostelium discoideum TaxID=44689 RepID=Q54J53_DICDI|nr:beta-xylosidase-like protein [Dictyostelium discoideum AX4]EAL63287.1 beta-xylosidase-like protein [Dictyostelium discoideum AX4]|eukprot:XP_636794.1 beta-xylosidase-like protein [Dictyostelium discoideum AX4]
MSKLIISLFVVVLFVLQLVSSQQCETGSVQFTSDLSNLSDWDHYWERTVGSGHAVLALREDWRRALALSHEKLGFQSVRFHGIFDDDLSVVQLDSNGSIIYSWYDVDQAYDYIVELGMAPYVELSFMPELLASGNATIFHYKGNITPPKNYTQWSNLIQAFITHVVDRYGMDVVSQWQFEIWNEPNCGFWSSDQTNYFKLLLETFNAIKSIYPQLSVGGPATCQSAWIPETLAFAKANGIQLDFVSTHEYPTDIQPLQRNIMKQVLTNSRQQVGPNMKLYYSEYNDGLFFRHDTTYASAFIMFNIPDVYGIADIFSWWCFSDVFEEQGQQSVPFNQGFGLLTIYDIPKPSFKAFELLHETGKMRANVTGEHPTAGVFTTLSDDEIMVIIYNHNIPDAPIANETICVTLENIQGTITDSYLRRIDHDNCNPIATWTAMGEPEYPTKSQIDQLKAAAEFNYQPIDFNQNGNSLTFTLEVMPQGVAAVTFKFQ